MHTNSALTVEALDQQGYGLRLSFVWHRDRYAHTIAGVEGGRIVPLLASEEGRAQEEWPASGPLQSLQVQQPRDGESLILLVGMAGTSHWSLSVQTEGQAAALLFDVACRTHTSPDWLGSSYRTMVPVRCRSSRAHLAISGMLCRVDVTAVNDTVGTLQETDTGLQIGPSLPHGPFPKTVRWRYRISQQSVQPP